MNGENSQQINNENDHSSIVCNHSAAKASLFELHLIKQVKVNLLCALIISFMFVCYRDLYQDI